MPFTVDKQTIADAIYLWVEKELKQYHSTLHFHDMMMRAYEQVRPDRDPDICPLMLLLLNNDSNNMDPHQYLGGYKIHDRSIIGYTPESVNNYIDNKKRINAQSAIDFRKVARLWRFLDLNNEKVLRQFHYIKNINEKERLLEFQRHLITWDFPYYPKVQFHNTGRDSEIRSLSSMMAEIEEEEKKELYEEQLAKLKEPKNKKHEEKSSKPWDLILIQVANPDQVNGQPYSCYNFPGVIDYDSETNPSQYNVLPLGAGTYRPLYNVQLMGPAREHQENANQNQMLDVPTPTRTKNILFGNSPTSQYRVPGSPTVTLAEPILPDHQAVYEMRSPTVPTSSTEAQNVQTGQQPARQNRTPTVPTITVIQEDTREQQAEQQPASGDISSNVATNTQTQNVPTEHQLAPEDRPHGSSTSTEINEGLPSGQKPATPDRTSEPPTITVAQNIPTKKESASEDRPPLDPSTSTQIQQGLLSERELATPKRGSTHPSSADSKRSPHDEVSFTVFSRIKGISTDTLTQNVQTEHQSTSDDRNPETNPEYEVDFTMVTPIKKSNKNIEEVSTEHQSTSDDRNREKTPEFDVSYTFTTPSYNDGDDEESSSAAEESFADVNVSCTLKLPKSTKTKSKSQKKKKKGGNSSQKDEKPKETYPPYVQFSTCGVLSPFNLGPSPISWENMSINSDPRPGSSLSVASNVTCDLHYDKEHYTVDPDSVMEQEWTFRRENGEVTVDQRKLQNALLFHDLLVEVPAATASNKSTPKKIKKKKPTRRAARQQSLERFWSTSSMPLEDEKGENQFDFFTEEMYTKLSEAAKLIAKDRAFKEREKQTLLTTYNLTDKENRHIAAEFAHVRRLENFHKFSLCYKTAVYRAINFDNLEPRLSADLSFLAFLKFEPNFKWWENFILAEKEYSRMMMPIDFCFKVMEMGPRAEE